MPSPYFADRSNNNDMTFDPAAYRKAGHVIIELKASEGTSFADGRHRGWCLQAASHHIAVIHYHFGRPDFHPGAAGGKAEAEWFLHVTNGLRGPHDYVMYDGERAQNGAFGLDPEHSAGFDAEIQRQTRFHTLLYASASELTAHGKDALVGNVKRDVDANYSSSPDTHADGHVCVIRQFTDGSLGPGPHSLPGVGRGDTNILRGEFARTVFANA